MKFFFFILLSFKWAQAQVLLVPANDISFEKYQEQCLKPGYLCTNSYFLEHIQKQQTPQFDSLVNDLDYSSEKFCNELPQRILRLLKEEMISLEQVEILQKMIEQAKNFSNAQKLRQLQSIEKQLKENVELTQNEYLSELPASFLVMFKKPVANKVEKKLKSDLFKVKTARLEFNSDLETHQPLVSGECQKEVLHNSIQSSKWQVARDKTCSFSEQFTRTSSSTSNFISENKTTLIAVGVLAVGAAILLNKYDVQMSF